MEWFIAGLVFAFFTGLTYLINQKYQIDGHLISGMRGMGVGLVYCTGVLFVPFPHSWLFWGFLAIQVGLSTYYNAKVYEASAKYGAGGTSRIVVLSIAFGMIFWWIIDYQRFLMLLHNPLVLGGIVLSLVVVSVGFYFMVLHGQKSQPQEVKYLMPAVIMLAFMLINRKEIMEHSNPFSALVYYCTFSIFFSGLINIIIYIYKNGKNTFKQQFSKKQFWLASISMIMASSLTIAAGNIAVLDVPNPAYINAISLTTPIFVMLVDKINHRTSKLNLTGLTIMILGLAVLIYLGNLPVSLMHL